MKNPKEILKELPKAFHTLSLFEMEQIVYNSQKEAYNEAILVSAKYVNSVALDDKAMRFLHKTILSLKID